MKHIPKVSVIVPVYGVEKYIERCARSLFEQTLDNIEYIFVNDCSPDKSIDILMKTLEDYPNRKNQVKVITMERNSGQAAVRRRGMLEAKGEYQIHCDSDDWVEVDMYEKMYQKAVESGSDVVSCNFKMEKRDGVSDVVENSDNPDPRIHINNDFQGVWWTLWSRLVRTQLINEHNIFPIPGMNMWEDIFVILRVYYYANHLSHVAEPFYHYVVGRDGSIVAKRMEKHILQQKIFCITSLELFFKTVEFDASKFLNFRKCMVKSIYLEYTPVDYIRFLHCFPSTKKYVMNCPRLYRICWEYAANGITLPHRLYVIYYNLKSWIYRKLRRN